MIQIRPVEPRDAAAMLDLKCALDHETSFMMLEPGERKTTLDQVRTHIEAILETVNEIEFVADTGSSLAGYIGAYGGEYLRSRNTVYMVAGVRQAYTGQGIGTALFQAVETWARQRFLHRLELTVMCDNQAGLALYKKMGFEVEGVRRDSLLVSGRYVDEYYMGKILS